MRLSEKKNALRKLGFSGSQIDILIHDGYDESIINDAINTGELNV